MHHLFLFIFLINYQLLFAQSGNPLIDLNDIAGRKIALSHNGSGNDFYGFGFTANRLDMFAGANINQSPDVVVTGDGNIGVGLTNPDRRLQVRGDAKIEGEIHNIVNGTANMLALAYGTIGSNGSKSGGTSNLGAIRLSTGFYRILVTNEALSINTCAVSVTPITFNQALFGTITEESGNGILVNIYDVGGNRQDAFFTVTVHKH